jgi:hypothetical protein
MNDLMIDLETLSTHNDAAIISIGACLFDMETGQIGPTFHTHIELDDSLLRGHISADTVKWWLKQDDAARNAIASPAKTVKLASALFNLCEFITRNKALNLWSNGATFDLVIIRNALERFGYSIPWQYWQERDTRTLVDIAERITGINAAKTTEFTGTKHDALADAIHQAKYISRAFNLIKTYTQTTL